MGRPLSVARASRPVSHPRRGESAIVRWGLAAIWCGGLVAMVLHGRWTDPGAEYAEIAQVVDWKRSEGVERAEQQLAAHPGDRNWLWLAVQGNVASSRHERALELLRQVPCDDPAWTVEVEAGLARRYESLGRLGDIEGHWRRVLELDPNHKEGLARLGHILNASGRVWEASPLFFRLILLGKCRGDELLGAAAVEKFMRQDQRFTRIDAPGAKPDPLPRLARARHALFENRTAEAETLLREVIALRPDCGEAQGRLGRIYVDREDVEAFLNWKVQLSPAAADHPEVWFTLGLEAQHLGQPAGAVRCFLEVLDRSPNHLGGTLQMGGALLAAGRANEARAFGDRARRLAELEALFNVIRGNDDERNMVRASQILESLGRYWEAAGWYQIQLGMDIPHEGPLQELQRLLPLARRSTEQTCLALSPVKTLTPSDFAYPVWPSRSGANPDTTRSQPAAPSVSQAGSSAGGGPIRFEEQAAAVGITFRYDEGTTEKTRLQHIFNVVGGGLAAIDYDLDGWPDLYLPQGNDWRNPDPQPQRRDELYRNLQGIRFANVTSRAGITELGFSHGANAADCNADGFFDLFITNMGPDSLWCNNGDGTFEETTAAAGVAGGDEWSTSSVFVDVSGDGDPDLYVLNYSPVVETAVKECRGSRGQPESCTPSQLTPDAARLYVNQGDGLFREVSDEAGLRSRHGRGLGVVAWDFDGDGRLDLFAGNDTSENFLWMNRTEPGGPVRFEEEGAERGVALDGDGNPIASMGIAAGDADGDGRLDLFLTNYYKSPNILFRQVAGGAFEDATRLWNLRDSGYFQLGFGTQFADFDGDGREDLIATNGHVNQQAVDGTGDRMPPQVFRNLGGRFDEADANGLGGFFERKTLGRGLALLDWNRDGRTDVGISHLHDPFALLTNRSAGGVKTVTVRLVDPERRPVLGAVVSLTEGTAALPTRRQTRFATGGGGYLVTNEPTLRFGLSAEGAPVRVTVIWPGGRQESWEHVLPEGEIVLVRGESHHFPFRVEPILTSGDL